MSALRGGLTLATLTPSGALRTPELARESRRSRTSVIFAWQTRAMPIGERGLYEVLITDALEAELGRIDSRLGRAARGCTRPRRRIGSRCT